MRGADGGIEEYQESIWLHLRQLLPLPYRKRVVLPVSFETAQRGLAAHIDGDWSLDGGRRWTYRRPHVLYQDTQHYVGVVDGNFFHLAGPIGHETLPMVIEGELWPYGKQSVLTIVARTPLSNMARTVIGFVALAVITYMLLQRYALTAAADADELLGMVKLAIGLAGAYALAIAISMSLRIHGQMRLLVKRLTDCAQKGATVG